MTKLRIATRRSNLALRQSRLVADAIRADHEHLEIELVAMTTRGDRVGGRLASAGGKGLFTRELEQALRSGRVQLAVHSAKDLPTEMAGEFTIAAVPARADPRDALVSRFAGVDGLPAGAAVGTGSPRRRAQLLALRADLAVAPVRGNVETRLSKALAPKGGLDAAVLAMAGLLRSGLADSHAEFIHPLDIEDVIPAAGQGVLAVQALRDNVEVVELLAPLDDPAARAALSAERGVLRRLGADCHSCLAVHVAPQEDRWCARGMIARPDGSDMVRVKCLAGGAEEAAEALLAGLRERGAADLPGTKP
jgi:hydroxymethylbilane synthase